MKNRITSAFASDDFMGFLGADNKIYLLNWKGNLLKTLELDHPASYVSYDEADKTLYGVNRETEEVYCYSRIL